MYMEEENNTTGTGDPSGLLGRFDDANFSLKTKMKICSNLHWIMKMWRIQSMRMLKKEDETLPHFITMKAASWKMLETENF